MTDGCLCARATIKPMDMNEKKKFGRVDWNESENGKNQFADNNSITNLFDDQNIGGLRSQLCCRRHIID